MKRPATFLELAGVTGLSEESQFVLKNKTQFEESYYFPISFSLPLELEFALLAEEWKRETILLSAVDMITSHQAYKRIIGMGWPVVPLILQDLESDPALWFEGLTAITDAQPIPREHAGDLKAMANDWIEWGKQNAVI